MICVCDGGDLSGYSDVLDHEWPFRFTFVSIEQGGPARARNAGLREAVGRVVAFCEDDVRLDPHWLDIGSAPILADQCDVVDGEVESAHGSLRRGEGRRSQPAYLPCNLFVRRELAERAGGYDEGYYDGEVYFREDSDFGFRLESNGARVAIVPEAVVRHPEQFFDAASIRRHLRRYRMDALLYQNWPSSYRRSVEQKKIGPFIVGRPLHSVALLWLCAILKAAMDIQSRRSSAIGWFAVAFSCGLAVRARYRRPVWDGLTRPSEWLRTWLLPMRHLSALVRGARTFGGWGVLVPSLPRRAGR
ncbi:MAG: glycosyltransferase [Actinomycetota bacterium]|nr:glycosyltransferase [Actinomycetota bacterium]